MVSRRPISRTARWILPLAWVSLGLFNCDAIFDIVPPKIKIIKPEKDVSYFGTLPVVLEVTDNRGVEKVEVYLENELVHLFSQPPYSVNLTIPEYGRIPPYIEVVAYDQVDNYSKSSRAIGVSHGLKITAPSGGEQWPETSSQTISWASYKDADSRINLEYSKDAGSNWIEIESAVYNRGTYSWDIPEMIGTKDSYQIRISDESMGQTDISTGTFTIWGADLIGHYDTPGRAHGVTFSDQYLFLADDTAGFHIFNVSNPQIPILITTYRTDGLVGHVDVSSNYAYVADYYRGVYIVNISDHYNPALVSYLYTPYRAWHIQTVGGYAYVAGRSAGLQIIDVRDPANPSSIGSSSQMGDSYRVLVSGNYAYLGNKDPGLEIYDISNPVNPDLISYLNTTQEAVCLAISGNHLYIAAVRAGLEIVDVSEPSNPILTAVYDTDGHAEGIVVSGRYAFLADLNELKIFDVSDPANPLLLCYYETPGQAVDLILRDNNLFLSDGENGLMIFDISGLP